MLYLWREARLILLLSVVLLGCQDDTQPDRASPWEGGLYDAAMTVDDATVAAPAFDAAAGPATEVQCGMQSCQQAVSLNNAMRPCCFDPETSSCGFSLLIGKSCTPIPRDVPDCPAVALREGLKLASCCTQENQCGINGSMFGLPACTSLDAARAMGWGGSLLPLPEPRPCGMRLDAGATEDAGADASDVELEASVDDDAQTSDTGDAAMVDAGEDPE